MRLFISELEKAVHVCVCVFIFVLLEERKGQGGQVQGTALCLRGYPCWGNVFKIYYAHS